MYRFSELRKLVACQIHKLDSDSYSIICDEHGQYRNLTIRGDIRYLAYILSKIQAADNILPRSILHYDYDEFAQKVDSGEITTIYLWLHNLNKIKNNRFYND